MNKLLFIVSIFLVMNQAIAQSCKTIVVNQTIFPTTTETLSLDLTDIFQGQNLTFSNPDPLTTVYNYANPVDNGNTLPAGVTFIQNAIYSQQSNEEWNGQTAFLGSTPTQVVVYVSNFTNAQTPNFQNSIPLLQEGSPLTCLGLTYTSSRSVIVDCYNVNNGLLVNEWQLVETVQTQASLIIPSSNNQSIQSGVLGFGRVIQFFRNATSGNEYLYRATLNARGGPSALEIFQVEDNFPSLYPIVTLNSSNITNLQIVDFEIAPNGALFVLNQTNVLIAYTLDETNKVLIEAAQVKLSANVSYLAIDIGIDFKFTTSGGYSILLATTSIGYNIEEWIVIGTQAPLPSGFYAVPAQLTYTGIPTQMDINNKHILVQDKSIVYLFERGVADLLPSEFQQFNQNQPLFTIQGIYAELNKIPEALLVFTPTSVQVSLLSVPTLIFQIQTEQSGSLTLNAISNLGSALPVICTAIVNYNVILESNYTVLQTNSVALPTTALFPINTTIDISQYFSGPLIIVSGVVTSEVPQNESSIFDSTFTPFQINVKGYPTQNVVFAYNSFNEETNTFLQFVQSGQQLLAYYSFKGAFDVDSKSFQVGSLEQTQPLTKLAVMYQSKQPSDAYLIVPSNNTILNVYEVVYTNEASRSINKLYASINFTQNSVSLNISDFTVLGDRLFVVLNEINQIWVYQIANKNATRLYQITSQNFTNVDGFFPIGIIGDYQTYGPILFINNQVSTLIVSTIGDQIKLISTITYPLQILSMTSTNKLVGTDLLIIQYKGGESLQEQISQYSLIDLFNPVKVKNLPFYDQTLKFPLQISSDNNFLYVAMSNNALNVYKPSASSHETLYRQINDFAGQSINLIFTGANQGASSYIFVGDGNKVKNVLLSRIPTVTFVPGQQINQYYTNNTYLLTVTNPLGSEPFVLQQKILIFNSQLGIAINTEQQKSENTKYVVTKKGINTYKLDTNFIYGDVARYRIDCPLCRAGEIKLINHLEAGTQQIGNLQGLQAMTNYPGKYLTFVQNTNAIYTVSAANVVNLVYTFDQSLQTLSSCNVLSLEEKRTFLLSVCESGNLASPQITVTVLNISQQPFQLISSEPISDIVDVIKGNLLGRTIFLLGTNAKIASSRPSILILNQIKGVGTLTDTLTCSNDPAMNGVNDFTVVAIQNLAGTTAPITNITTYALIWTCEQPELGVQYTTFVFDEIAQIIGTIEPKQTLELDLTFPLLDDTTFLQIQTLTKSITQRQTNLNVIITTNNLFSFIFQVSFTFGDEIAPQSLSRLITTIPPYGLWTKLNSLSYSSGLLAIPYTKDNRNFLALYNVTDLRYDTKRPTPPLTMFGGFYEDVLNTADQQWVFNIQEINTASPSKTQILTANSNFAQNLSSIFVQPQIEILINVPGSFQNQKVLVTAENDYSNQQFQINIDYNESSNTGGIRWWGWILIVLAILIVVSGITLGLVKFMKGREDRGQAPLLN